MATLDELYSIEDPRRLFILATDAINRHRENVDEMALIRARAVVALYAQGYSYKELAQTLGVSAPRVGQLIAGSSEALVEVLRAWHAIEDSIYKIASLVSDAEPYSAHAYQEAVSAISNSGRVDKDFIFRLDSIRELRNHLIHGRADINVETAEDVLNQAIHANAVLTVWIHDEAISRRANGAESEGTGGSKLSSLELATKRLAQLARDEAALRKQYGDANAAAARARATAAAKREQAAKTSSSSMARSYLRTAATAEKKAASEDKKAADVTKKLHALAQKTASTRRDQERMRKAAEKVRDSADAKRRSTEKRHAQDIARLSRPVVRYVHEIREVAPAKPEILRVLYLTSNPDSDAYLRVDVEVRGVRQAVRRAIHRDLIDVDHRPAATPEDLLDGMDEQRPHVVHFAGHSDGYSLLFDDAEIDDPSGRVISFDLLARALASTDSPPTVLVLNACDTLLGAEVLLESVAVIVAMNDRVSDLAAAAFAARFYSTIANGQSVRSAVDRGSVAVDMLELTEGWKPTILARDDVEPGELVLVKVPDFSQEDDVREFR